MIDVMIERRNYLKNKTESNNIFGIKSAAASKNYFKGSDAMPFGSEKQPVPSQILPCDAAGVIDLRNVVVNREKPFSERRDDFIRQVRNPYLFRVGSTIVRVEFGEGKNFEQMFFDAILAG